MDKWLWAARFFKTRALAARACELGRIQSNGQPAKSARDVRIGDMLCVTNEGGVFQVEVLLLSEVRGPASVAQTLYRETEAARELRLKVAAERKDTSWYSSRSELDGMVEPVSTGGFGDANCTVSEPQQFTKVIGKQFDVAGDYEVRKTHGNQIVDDRVVGKSMNLF